MTKNQETYFGPAIRQLLMCINNGLDYKKWLRNQLRRKGFVCKAYTKTQDRISRKRFQRYLDQEQQLIDQFRKAIKVLRREEALNSESVKK
jgi:hypothetical protein